MSKPIAGAVTIRAASRRYRRLDGCTRRERSTATNPAACPDPPPWLTKSPRAWA